MTLQSGSRSCCTSQNTNDPAGFNIAAMHSSRIIPTELKALLAPCRTATADFDTGAVRALPSYPEPFIYQYWNNPNELMSNSSYG